jgi:hypothetical protein
MKIELTSNGVDDAIGIIRNDLKSLLNAKTKKRKDELAYHALGAAETLFQLIMVREEAEKNSTDPISELI